jgi:hypothetical protein
MRIALLVDDHYFLSSYPQLAILGSGIEGIGRQWYDVFKAHMQRVCFAVYLGDLALDLALAFAPADSIAGPDVHPLGAHVGVGEINREAFATQCVNWKPCITPTVATPLDVYGSVGLLHCVTLNYQG